MRFLSQVTNNNEYKFHYFKMYMLEGINNGYTDFPEITKEDLDEN